MTEQQVTIVIPAYNDRTGLERAVESLLRQERFDELVSKVLICDGGSSDGTLAMVEEMSARDPRIELIANPDKTVPYAMNLAIEAMRTELLLRVDTHATLEPDYLRCAVEVLERTGADVVGGAVRPYGNSMRASAVAWAMTSFIASGGSTHHFPDREGPADTVYLGVFRRAAFERHGLFDTTYTRNQDDEFTSRVIEGGGLVYQSSTLRCRYRARGSITQLAVQYFSYGLFKPGVLRKHPRALRPWHLAPPVAALAWFAVPFAVAAPPLAIPAAAHLLVVLWASRSRSPMVWATRAGVVLAMHLGYGSGFAISSFRRSVYLSDRVRNSRDRPVRQDIAWTGPRPAPGQ